MSIDLRPAAGRPVTEAPGRRTAHSFSFGAHYDPANTGFAAITAVNDEHLDPGGGYPDHPHAAVEILTWVLDGALRHTDSSGRATVLGPGDLLRTSAGTGIVHSEVAEPGSATRFLQTWIRPDDPGLPPSFGAVTGTAGQPLTELTGLGIGTRGAGLHLGRVETSAILPEAAAMHLFVVDGEIALGDRALTAGDAARLRDEGGRDLIVRSPATLALWTFRESAPRG